MSELVLYRVTMVGLDAPALVVASGPDEALIKAWEIARGAVGIGDREMPPWSTWPRTAKRLQ